MQGYVYRSMYLVSYTHKYAVIHINICLWILVDVYITLYNGVGFTKTSKYLSYFAR